MRGVELRASKVAPSPGHAARVTLYGPPAFFGALTLLLGFIRLGRASLWLDEAVSANLSRAPWHAFWHAVSTKEANMSLYYVLLRAWRVFGSSEAAARSLSVVCAAATIPVVYFVARRLVSERVALVATALLSVNGFFVHYAHEARGYTLVVLLTSLSTLLLLRAVESSSARRWVFYGLVAGLSLYAHFFAGFVIVAQLLFVAPRFVRGTLPRRAVLMGLGAGLVVAAPLLVFMATAPTGQIAWIPQTTLRTVVPTFKALAGLGGKPLLAAFFLACFAGSVALMRSRRFLTLTWFGVPVAIAFGISLAIPIVRPQYLIVVVPPLAVLAAAGVGLGPVLVRAVATALLVALAIAALPHMYSSIQTHDWRGAEAYVAANSRAGDKIVFDQYYGWVPFSYYATRRPSSADSLFPPESLTSNAIVHERPLMDSVDVAAAAPRVWLVLNNARTDHPAPELKDLLTALLKAHVVSGHAEFQGGIRITLYSM